MFAGPRPPRPSNINSAFFEVRSPTTQSPGLSSRSVASLNGDDKSEATVSRPKKGAPRRARHANLSTSRRRMRGKKNSTTREQNFKNTTKNSNGGAGVCCWVLMIAVGRGEAETKWLEKVETTWLAEPPRKTYTRKTHAHRDAT